MYKFIAGVKSKVDITRPSDCIKNKRATEKGGYSSIKTVINLPLNSSYNIYEDKGKNI